MKHCLSRYAVSPHMKDIYDANHALGVRYTIGSKNKFQRDSWTKGSDKRVDYSRGKTLAHGENQYHSDRETRASYLPRVSSDVLIVYTRARRR